MGPRDGTTIRDRVEEIHSAVIRIDERMNNVDKLLAKHNDTLYGNGKTGLTTEMEMAKDFRRNVRWGLGLLWSALGACLTAAVTWARS